MKMENSIISEKLKIEKIVCNKKIFLPLLIIGDESESMIDRYLERGDLYVGKVGDKTVAVCVTVIENDHKVEVKNLAVDPKFQRKGIGRNLLNHIERLNSGKTIILGTGETPSTLRFYQSCGYVFSHRIDNFFTDNYPDPIIEEGITLRDMIYLKKDTSCH